MRVYISGLSLGPANLDKQVSRVARNVVEESEIRGSGRIVGNPYLGTIFGFPVTREQSRELPG
jgi:hypothetical protein